MDTDLRGHNQCYQCHLGQFLKEIGCDVNFHCLVPYICQVQYTFMTSQMKYFVLYGSVCVCVCAHAPAGQLHPSWQWSSHVWLAEGLEHVSGQELMHSLNSMLREQFLSVNVKAPFLYL